MSEDLYEPRFVKAVFDRSIGISHVCSVGFTYDRQRQAGDRSKALAKRRDQYSTAALLARGFGS